MHFVEKAKGLEVLRSSPCKINLFQVATPFPQLERHGATLRVLELDFPGHTSYMNDGCLIGLLERCPNLEQLGIFLPEPLEQRTKLLVS